MKLLAIIALLFISPVISALTIDEQQAIESSSFTTLHPGELLAIPIRKGNFVRLLYGKAGDSLWYDARTEFFTYMPIRNYSTIYMDITRMIPEGDYQFLEVDADDDPTKITNWKWVRSTKVRIEKCDGFKLC